MEARCLFPSARIVCILCLVSIASAASPAPTMPVAPVMSPCPRFVSGGYLPEPVNLWSSRGVLQLVLNWQTTVDAYNNTLYCYMMPDGLSQSPILRVDPGDRLLLTLVNLVPPENGGSLPSVSTSVNQPLTSITCGASTLDSTSTNMHFHGTSIRPVCEQVRPGDCDCERVSACLCLPIV